MFGFSGRVWASTTALGEEHARSFLILARALGDFVIFPYWA